MDAETTRDPRRPFRRGFPGGAPRGRRRVLRLRAPAQPMLQRGGGGRSGASPGAGLGARAGPGGGPGGRARSRVGLRRAPGSGDSGERAARGATRQGCRRARFAPGLRLTLRTPPAGDPPPAPLPPLLGYPGSGRQKSYLGCAGSRARGGVGTARCTSSGRRCAGGAGVGREPQTRAARAAPRPPLQGTRRLGGAAAGAHAQRGARRGERAPPARCGPRGRRREAAAVLQDSYLLSAASVLAGGGGRGDNASIQLPRALAFGCQLRWSPRALCPLLSPPTRRLAEWGRVFLTSGELLINLGTAVIYIFFPFLNVKMK